MTKSEKDELTNFKFKVMDEKISTVIEELRSLSAKVDGLGGRFATKEEYDNSARRIDKLEGKVETFNLKVATWSGSIAAAAFIAQYLFK